MPSDDYSRAGNGHASESGIQGDILTGNPTSPTDTDALFYTVPAPPRYINEAVHILPYSEDERIGDWLTKWTQRPTNFHMETLADLNAFLNGSETTEYVLTDTNKDLYAENPYNERFLFEIYHPSVFTNPQPYWNSISSLNPTTPWPYAIRILSPVPEEKQFYFKENDKVHTQRMEIAAKAALMLYRSKDIDNDPPAFGFEQAQNCSRLRSERDRAKMELKNALATRNSSSSSDYYRNLSSLTTSYNSAQNSLASFLSPYKHMDNKILNALDAMSSADDLLPALLNAPYRNWSCYGLWGKWYNRANGFHRGIDIHIELGAPIYSICSGEVVDKSAAGDTITVLVVRVDTPVSDRGKHLTYMHADFTKDVGQRVRLGEKIGTESYHMVGGTAGSAHTHIELNENNKPACRNTNLASDSTLSMWFTQPKQPRESMYSTPPYDFIKSCYKDFYDSLHNPER